MTTYKDPRKKALAFHADYATIFSRYITTQSKPPRARFPPQAAAAHAAAPVGRPPVDTRDTLAGFAAAAVVVAATVLRTTRAPVRAGRRGVASRQPGVVVVVQIVAAEGRPEMGPHYLGLRSADCIAVDLGMGTAQPRTARWDLLGGLDQAG